MGNKIILGILLLGLTVAAWGDEMQTLHEMVLNNFTEIPQHSDRIRFPDGTKPFRGDCDDFAIAVYLILKDRGYKDARVWLVQKKNPGASRGNKFFRHVITCTDEVCFDNLLEEIQPVIYLYRNRNIKPIGWNQPK